MNTIGEEAYDLRIAGNTWPGIATTLGRMTPGAHETVRTLAHLFAVRNGRPWPPTVGGDGGPDAVLRAHVARGALGARAYAERMAGHPWSTIADMVWSQDQRPLRANIIVFHMAKNFARNHGMPWPIHSTRKHHDQAAT